MATMTDTKPKEKVSKAWAWMSTHKGMIEVLDPELRSQMMNYRDEYKQKDNEMITEITTESATEEVKETAAPTKGRMAWAVAHEGFIEVLDPELRAQMVNFRDEYK